MYVEKTSHQERCIIDNAVYDKFCNMDRASRLLYRVLEEYFSDLELRPLAHAELQDVCDTILTVYEILEDNITSYYMTVGRKGGYSSSLVESVERYKQAIKEEET